MVAFGVLAVAVAGVVALLMWVGVPPRRAPRRNIAADGPQQAGSRVADRDGDAGAHVGFRSAVALYRWLEAEHPVPVVPSPGWVGEPVYLDAVCRYARWYAARAVARAVPGLVVAAPAGFLLAAAAGQALADAMRHAGAASDGPRWREAGWARVVVTASATWCCQDGAWLAFWHDAVVGYRFENGIAVLTFAGCEPLLLSGPAVWVHAVLFARLRLGQHWAAAPWLQGLRNR